MEAILEQDGKFIYNTQEIWNRVDGMIMGRRVMGITTTRVDAFIIVMKNMKKLMDEKLAIIDSYHARFIGTPLEKYWAGKIDFMTKAEIYDFNLIIQSAEGKLTFNRKEVSRLARTMQKREGLNLSLAMYHAWFWARTMKFDSIEHLSEQRKFAKSTAREAMATHNRKILLLPEEHKYYEIKKMMLEHKRKHLSLIIEDDRHAPRSVSQNWCTNIGNIFDHPKYGDCVITKHKNLSKGWVIIYTSVNGGKEYTMELHKFRCLSKAGQYPVIKPINELCESDLGLYPTFDGISV